MSASVPPHGFTLLEVMVALTIMSIVTALAVPGFANLLAERRVAAGASAYAAALRKAQVEASARNRTVEVLFTATDPIPTAVVTAVPAAAVTARRWMVRQASPTVAADFVTGFSLIDQTPTVTVDAPLTAVGFTPLGRPVDRSGGANAALADTLVVRFTDAGTARRLCTYLSTGGAVRVCDPSRAAGQTGACQPQLAAGAC